ncbi:MAG TPA: MBL fold metallo-hydrolase [Bryobacteraceae bacterium]|nr:MBL fold metallo-hydrolase [Bryobacteraceae bacterium]
MKLQQFEVPGLAHYSYLLASQGKALVIDPRRDIDVYLKYAETNRLSITHVLETHIHADYASGATALAKVTSAQLWLSGHDEGEDYAYQFAHRKFRDGDEVELGDLRLVAVHTPGHTPEHLSFLVYEKSRCGQPVALFTGDFIFVGSVGRPDLLGEEAKTRLAHLLYQSVRTRVDNLPDGVELYPGHGAGSLCGAGMGEREHSTLGYERFCNVFMADRPEAEFVDILLKTLPPAPDYYRRMKHLNSEGPPLLESIPGAEAHSAAKFRELADTLEAVIIDLRRPEAFGGAHIPKSLNIGAGQNLSMWAGWVVAYDRPILLVGNDGTDLEAARRSLIRVGLDDVRGYLKGGMAAWIEAGFEQEYLPQQSVRELADQLAERPFVLDVRSQGEWNSGHIAGATHIPGGELPKRTHDVPQDRPVHVVCGSGYRSSIAASVLARAGFQHIINIAGGMGAWKEQNLPT